VGEAESEAVMSVRGTREGVSCVCGGGREWGCHVSDGEGESRGIMSVCGKERVEVSGQ
jgi:hypothetical protein